MPTRYIAKVGTKAIGAVPLYQLTDNSNNFMLCMTSEAVNAMVDRARDRGVAIDSFVIETVDV